MKKKKKKKTKTNDFFYPFYPFLKNSIKNFLKLLINKYTKNIHYPILIKLLGSYFFF